MKKIIIHWFRKDLRIHDNPSLFEACQNAQYVLPIYILDNHNAGEYFLGAASRWWLHHSLNDLKKSLAGNLSLYHGNPLDIIQTLIQKYSISCVYWNRCYEPWTIKRDIEIKKFLTEKNIEVKTFNSSLLWEPWTIKKNDQTAYKVFTPYYKKGCLCSDKPRNPLGAAENHKCIYDETNTLMADNLDLLPKIRWDLKFKPYWKIGENSAQESFDQFIEQGLNHYKGGRNLPFRPYVSRISPHLHFGEISPHQLWYQIHQRENDENVENFSSQLAWREFSYYQLYHYPSLPKKNIQSKFDQFPWEKNETALEAWKQGKTGIPMIDAGMRELWQTGYMHNRVRLITGSFLVKNLNIHWKYGERWFWDCLVDADLANNSASWQWVAGCGFDSAPYYRIFNPILQGQKFDPNGDYIRRFVPEIACLPNEYLYSPFKISASILKTHGIQLGVHYPEPIIDLAMSRNSALNLFHALNH